MRYALIVLWMLLWSVTSAVAQVSIGIGLPSVSIGINLPLYPELVQVPGYPVYYAPQVDSNFFFYDGMYWVYQRDNWYASSWYNGPWGLVDPEVVPLFVLRVPVRYYRAPPAYFRGWRSDASPRWGEHWGNQWQQRRSGWDNWDRRSVPAPAPLPVYQRQFSGNQYPRAEQQQTIRSQNYRYQPRDAVVQQHFKEQAAQPAPSQRGRQETPQERSPKQQDVQRPASPQQSGPAGPRPQQSQRGGEDVQRPVPTTQAAPQQRGTGAQGQNQQPQQREGQREQQTPRADRENNPQGQGASQEPRRGQGQEQRQEKDRDKGEERGQERGQERNR